MSAAKDALNFSGLFESELLVELMLRYWKHPFADDSDFRNNLLETAAEALRLSIAGKSLIDTLQPKDMNLVAAVWYAEWSSVAGDVQVTEAERINRENWLNIVRRALPSCFCDPDQLP